MAGVATFYSLQQVEQWAKAQDMVLQGVDFTPALKQCAVAIRGDTLQNFETASGPDGTAWPALEHVSTLSRRQGSSKPLMDRGLLAASATGRGPNAFEQITPKSLEVGSNLIQASLMQEGGEIKPKKAKALAIPVTPKARRVGSPRQWKDPTLFRPHGTNVLATAKQKGGKKKGYTEIEVQYILLAAVRIPPRPFLGFGPRLSQKMDDILGDFVMRFESR